MCFARLARVTCLSSFLSDPLNVQCSPLRQGLATASPGYLGKQTGNSKITSAKQWQNAKIQNNHCKILTMMQDFIIKHFVSSVTSERIVSDSATFSTSLKGTFLENFVFSRRVSSLAL